MILLQRRGRIKKIRSRIKILTPSILFLPLGTLVQENNNLNCQFWFYQYCCKVYDENVSFFFRLPPHLFLSFLFILTNYSVHTINHSPSTLSFLPFPSLPDEKNPHQRKANIYICSLSVPPEQKLEAEDCTQGFEDGSFRIPVILPILPPTLQD